MHHLQNCPPSRPSPIAPIRRHSSAVLPLSCSWHPTQRIGSLGLESSDPRCRQWRTNPTRWCRNCWPHGNFHSGICNRSSLELVEKTDQTLGQRYCMAENLKAQLKGILQKNQRWSSKFAVSRFVTRINWKKFFHLGIRCVRLVPNLLKATVTRMFRSKSSLALAPNNITCTTSTKSDNQRQLRVSNHQGCHHVWDVDEDN